MESPDRSVKLDTSKCDLQLNPMESKFKIPK